MSAAYTEVAIHVPEAQRMGFFTDTTTCIGCKACEVACKQWNDLPADELRRGKGRSYDYTGALSASTWRHVRFVETVKPTAEQQIAAQEALARGGGGNVPGIPAVGGSGTGGGGGGAVVQTEMPDLVDLAAGAPRPAPGPKAEELPSLVEIAEGGGGASARLGDFGGELGSADGALLDRWVFMSDVCKHCSNAGCLDACPTGALIRTEFETVIVQPDICNGCGYCVPACPFGVVDRDHDDGRAAKCTLCYDRLEDGLEPACAKACPTDSIQFGPYEELLDVAAKRVSTLHERGVEGAYLYGAHDAPENEIAGGLGAFFLLTEPPERFGLPAHADSPIQENVVPATLSAMGAGLLAAAGVAASFMWSRRR